MVDLFGFGNVEFGCVNVGIQWYMKEGGWRPQ